MHWLQSILYSVASPAVVHNVGWLLIHSLWQCMLVALLAMSLANMMRRQSSSARYWMFSMALLLMVVAPVVTFLAFPQAEVLIPASDQRVESASGESFAKEQQIVGDNGDGIPLVVPTTISHSTVSESEEFKPGSESGNATLVVSNWSWIRAMLTPWLSTIVVAWCCGVLLFSIWPVWGWLMVRRLLLVGTSPVAIHVQEALQRVCEKIPVRRVEVLASTLVGSPIVVGCFRSVILVPASFVANLPIAQLEAILAHELAHVQRYDYLVNFLQTLMETLFFYHPAVWWLSHRIRVERENCCDDLVVAVLNNKAEYGRALLAVEEFRGQASRSALALSVRDGSLLHRIRRLFAAPSVGGQRMSAGITAVATAVTSIITVLVFWSAMSAAQNKKEDVPFGEASHGLRARIVALRPDVNDSAPNLEFRQSDYVNSDEMTFGIELTNTGDEPVTLAGIRFGDGFAKEVQGKLRTELLGPHWFEFEFMDSEGKPIRRTHREFHEPWQVAESSSTHVLAPNQSMTEVLRPGKFRTPMDIDLPAGKYKVRLHYHGPNEEFREKVGKLWPNKAILNAWPYEVVSNTIDLRVAEGRKLSSGKGDTNAPDGSRLAAKLVWGKAVDGLQAAMEYRTAHDASADPAISPGIPIGTPFNVIFHVKNVSDKTITFISETGRQGDKVHVTNERGEKVDVKDVWYSGWPIDVAWKLEPGEMAQLSLLTPSLHSLDQPGRYNVRYTIRFNSRTQKDDAGNVIFPRPGDYDKEVDTGETPLFLTAVQTNSTAAKRKTQAATRAGCWQITDDTELEITQKTFHAADVMTSGVIRLKGDKDHPRHVPLSIAMDYFANRERWKAVWEQGQPVLWYAKGLGNGPGRILPPGTRVKIEELRRIDFRNPDCVVHHVFSGWIADQLPSAEIRAALEEEFEIRPDGRENHRYYESARHGLQLDETSRQMFVWVGENGNCQVQNLAWAPLTGESEHLKCDLKTLPETLALVLKKFRTKAGQDVPIYAFVTSRPDLPAKDLKTVLDACRKNGLKTPDMPEAIQVAATTEPASDSPHGEIRGLLTDIEGKPVAGAVVACGAIYREDGQDGGTRTTTDAEGHYRLVAPSPGIYTVFLKAYDRDPTLMAVADDGLKVEAGKVTESTLRLVAGRKVVGKAVDENGVPLAGLTVMCYSAARPHSLGTVQSTTANDDGAFEFYLAPGPGQIYATEMVNKTKENPFGTGRTGSVVLTIPKTGEIEPVTLKLWRSESRFGSDEWLTRSTRGTTIISHEHQDDVTGVVVDEAGKPLANAMVIKLDDKPVTTDAEGRFRVPVPKGTQFVMHAFHLGYRVWFGTPTAGDKLKIVMLKKRSPDVAPAANGNLAPAAQPKNPQRRLNEWKNAWREFYVAQSESDLTFARNAFMDLTGKAATDEDVRVFARMSAVDKRSQVIDKLLDGGAFEKFQAQLTSENDAFQSQQQALPSRILRGPQAKYRADVYRMKAGKPVNGLTLAIALRSATNRFRIGERIPLDVLVLNASNETLTRDFSCDFIADPPQVVDEAGNEIPIEKLRLTGLIPLYRETLRPGDYFVYPHIGLGLGENPTPGEIWHPHTPPLKPGKYRLTQSWNGLTSGEIEFEVVDDRRQAELPWRAFGKVVDGNGKPLPGVTVRAATGYGTLRGGQSVVTDENGHYDFRFGMGIIWGDISDPPPDPQTQYALISARLDGHFEKNFSRQGNGIASLEPVDAEGLKHWGVQADQVCLPDKPREVNFVMLPAARVSGTLVDEDDKPLKNYSVSLTADELPPGSSVLAQVYADESGRFEINDIPTTIAYQFGVRKPRAELRPPWDDSWASPPLLFADPGANDLVTTLKSPQVATNRLNVKSLKLKVVGTGIHGKEAVRRAAAKPLVIGSMGTRLSADEISLEEWTLKLTNEVAQIQPDIDRLPQEKQDQSTARDQDSEPESAWLKYCPGTQIVEHTDAMFVSGVVVDEAGKPIPNCYVEHPGIAGPKTDADGRFEYKQSSPNRTVLRINHREYRLWHGAPQLGDVLRVVLQKKPTVEAVDGQREMTVRVIDSRTAEPVPNVMVTASCYEGPKKGKVAAKANTNQDGTVVLRGLDFIQHMLTLSADRPIPYIPQRDYPQSDRHEVVMLVDRACELTLRAVDSQTGKGIAGVRFDRERAFAEFWAAPVVNDILGSNRNGETLTDEDGYARFLVGPATWSYMILKYPEGYDSIVPIGGGQEVDIKTPVGGKVEYTFRLVESRSQTNANGAAGARTKQQIVAAWTQRARDVEHSRLSWTENRIYPRGELISPNQAQPPADDFTVQWKKSLVISGDKCRVEGVGKTWLDRIGDFAPFEFTAVRNGTGSSLHHFPGQPESLGYSTPSLAGLCDVTYRPAMLGMNPADPEIGRIKLDDYHVEPDQVDIDGRMCLKLVRKDGRNVDTHVFLDPNRQFVVNRTVGLEGGEIARSFDLSYRQDERGVWYPAAWRLEIMNGTDSVRGFHITVVSTRFESQYDADPRSFAIEYPDGTQFHNLGKLDRRVAEKATAWKTRRPDSTESSSNEKGEILDDDSVLLSLPSPNNSTPVAKFKFSDATEINMLRLELLPDTRFEDRRLGRKLCRTLKLFDVKPSITFADGSVRTLTWDKCSYLQNPDDAEVSSLLDYATDTGWTVPPLAKDQSAHELVFQLKVPLKLDAGSTLLLELDSGGSNELDTIARFRVSFPTQDKPASKERK